MEWSLEELIVTITLGLTSGMFNYFFDFTLYEGNIFDFYYDFLLNKVMPKSPKLAKLMGICMVCLGFWLSLLFFCLVNMAIHLNWIMIIPFMSVASFVTRKLLEEG